MGSISNPSGSITRNSVDGSITDPLGSTITTDGGSQNFVFLLQENGSLLTQQNGFYIIVTQ